MTLPLTVFSALYASFFVTDNYNSFLFYFFFSFVIIPVISVVLMSLYMSFSHSSQIHFYSGIDPCRHSSINIQTINNEIRVKMYIIRRCYSVRNFHRDKSGTPGWVLSNMMRPVEPHHHDFLSSNHHFRQSLLNANRRKERRTDNLADGWTDSSMKMR